MKKLGQGLAWTCYATEASLVWKPAGRRTVMARLAKERPSLLVRPVRWKEATREAMLAWQGVRHALRVFRLSDALVAGYRLDGATIRQERVVPLGVLLTEGHDPHAIACAYVDAVHAGWQAGFSPLRFDLTSTHGLDARNRVVLFDLGCLSFDRSRVEEALRAQPWNDPAVWPAHLASTLREHLAATLSRELTTTALERHWQDATTTVPPLELLRPDKAGPREGQDARGRQPKARVSL